MTDYEGLNMGSEGFLEVFREEVRRKLSQDNALNGFNLSLGGDSNLVPIPVSAYQTTPIGSAPSESTGGFVGAAIQGALDQAGKKLLDNLSSDDRGVCTPPPELDRLMKEKARKYGIDEDFFISLIYQESRFNPNAKSHAGAQGLGQIMPATAKALGLNSVTVWDPEKNLDASAKYIAGQYRRFKSYELALSAYNAGASRVIKAGYQIPNIRETKDYVTKVIRRMKVRKQVFGRG